MEFREWMIKEARKDMFAEAKFGEQLSKQRIMNSQFKDLADFDVMIYTNQELKELGMSAGKWVGQYVKGSIDSPRGATVLINISPPHKSRQDIADTICHEMGHGLWELLDNEARQIWNQRIKDKWGPEEAFADDFMNFVRGQKWNMHNEELFLQLTVL